MQEDTLDELVLLASNNNKEAAQFLSIIVGLADFFDAVADGDTKIDRFDVELAIWNALVALPRNNYYREHFDMLNSILTTSILNWCVATDFEREADNQEYTLKIAYIIRSSYIDLFSAVAMTTGGPHLARQVCKRARLFVHNEGWEGYRDALDREMESRGGC